MVSDNVVREKWSNSIECILSLIGVSVGLGNIWRFPAMVYNNGGGAFVIAYFIINLLVGLPGYVLELALGQFTGKSPLRVFEMAPFWKGLGWSMTIYSFYTSLYYNVIIAWCLHFLFASFRTKLNWHLCTNSWNDDRCIDRDTLLGVETRSIKNNVSIVYCNSTFETQVGCTQGVFATSQYFNNYVLGMSDSFADFGTPSWSLSLCLLLAWILVCCCLLFGIKSSGKVVYVTATFPYFVLVILLIRGVTLKGSRDGIMYYISPDFSLLLNLKTWFHAANQVFFSLSIAGGSLIMYSSFNDFNNNLLRDAATVTVVDAFTSLIGGFAIFSILGFMSHFNKIPIDQLVQAGTGLAFVIYPEVLSNMPVGPLFSILFFLMLFTLGIDSQFAGVETFLKCMREQFNIPNKYKIPMVIGYCSLMFLLGLTFCCPGGFYLFELVSNYSSGQVLIIIGFFEFFIMAYIYGFNNFMEDIKMMLKKRICEIYFFVTWCFISPLIILVILIYMTIYSDVPIVNGKPLPDWGVALGWLLFANIMIPIPLYGIYKLYKIYKIRSHLTRVDMPNYLTILRHTNKPTRDWRPYEAENQVGRYEMQKNISSDMNENSIKFEDNFAFESVETYRF